jgi:hypothetical protein
MNCWFTLKRKSRKPSGPNNQYALSSTRCETIRRSVIKGQTGEFLFACTLLVVSNELSNNCSTDKFLYDNQSFSMNTSVWNHQFDFKKKEPDLSKFPMKG